MNKDLTVGNPNKIIWRFCLPLFGSIIFQQLYNIADSFVAGRFISEAALASVGNSYEITLILLAFAFGCNMGCSVLVSKLFGAKKYSDMKTAVATSMISSGVLCIVLMALTLGLGKYLLIAINTPEHLLADSQLYLDIYVYGLPFVFFYNISTGIFAALGDSKTPFIFLVCSSLANIGIDILFVLVFNMGVAGVAWATFMCQGIACILAMVVVLLRLRKIKTEEKCKAFSKPLFLDMMRVAIPSTMQQGFVSVGNILIQSVINGFGEGVMAGYSAAVKLNNLVITSFTTVGNGISNYTSQNLGADKPERIKSGLWAGLKFIWVLCVPLFAIYFFAGQYLIYIFLENPTTEATNAAVMFLRIVSPFYFVVGAKLAADGVLRGASKMLFFMIATFVDLILRVVLAFVLPMILPLGSTSIWIAWPIGWCIATAVSFILFFKCKWKPTAATTITEST